MVFDDASLSLAVSVLSGNPLQVGQTLVASATTNGDPNDANAIASYQWQTSSDGGATWTNVSATTTGNVSGILSSLYQLSALDEGKLFLATASFTDSLGQLISATSTPEL